MSYSLGSYRLSPEERSLSRAGEPQELEPRVFDLLVVLVENRDRVLSKDELLSAVWGDGFHTSDDTLFKAIQRVRSALGDNGRQQAWIKTFHGRGYRYVGQCEVVGHSGAETLDVESTPAKGITGRHVLAMAAFGLLLLAVIAALRLAPPERERLATEAAAAELRGDLEAAIGLRSALVALEPDSSQGAFALAHLLLRSGRLSEAEKLLEDQTTRASDTLDRYELALLWADLNERTDKLSEAQTSARQARSLAATLDRTDLTLRAALLESSLTLRLGDSEAARQLVDTLVEQAETLGSPELLAEAHLRLAQVLLETGDSAGFLTEEAKARSLFEQRENSVGIARIERERARVDSYAGDLESAVERLELSLALLDRAGDSFQQAVVVVDLADALTDLGRYDRAEKLYDRAAIQLADQGGLRRHAALENSRGILYNRLAESRTARRHFDKALRLYLQAENQGGAFATIYNLVTMSLENCEIDVADQYLSQAMEIESALSVSDRAAMSHLQGRVALERLRFAQAEQSFSQAFSQRLELGEDLDAAMSELMLSEVALESGDAELAFQLSGSARARVPADSSRFVLATFWQARAALRAGRVRAAEELLATEDQELALVLEVERDLALARLARAQDRTHNAIELAESSLTRAEQTRTHEIRLRSARLLEALKGGPDSEIRDEAERLGCLRIARSKTYDDLRPASR